MTAKHEHGNVRVDGSDFTDGFIKVSIGASDGHLETDRQVEFIDSIQTCQTKLTCPRTRKKSGACRMEVKYKLSDINLVEYRHKAHLFDGFQEPGFINHSSFE